MASTKKALIELVQWCKILLPIHVELSSHRRECEGGGVEGLLSLGRISARLLEFRGGNGITEASPQLLSPRGNPPTHGEKVPRALNPFLLPQLKTSAKYIRVLCELEPINLLFDKIQSLC